MKKLGVSVSLSAMLALLYPAKANAQVGEGGEPANDVDASKKQKQETDEILTLLSQKTVYEKDFARRVLYTWTTEKQIDELRKGKPLLSRSRSATNGPSNFDQVMQSDSVRNHPVAKLINQKQFNKKRFGWAHPFATLMGWEGETYGRHLLRIEFKPEAVIALIDPSHLDETRFETVLGVPVSLSEIESAPERLAAAYYLNKVEHTKKIKAKNFKRRIGRHGTFPISKPRRINKFKRYKVTNTWPYREYVILNENMIQSWQYGTDSVVRALRSELAWVTELSQAYDQESNRGKLLEGVVATRFIFDQWQRDTLYSPTYMKLWYAALALPNENYNFQSYHDAQRIFQALRVELQAALAEQGDPISSSDAK